MYMHYVTQKSRQDKSFWQVRKASSCKRHIRRPRLCQIVVCSHTDRSTLTSACNYKSVDIYNKNSAARSLE